MGRYVGQDNVSWFIYLHPATKATKTVAVQPQGTVQWSVNLSGKSSLSEVNIRRRLDMSS
jgi:hypothetical protein